MTRVTDNKYEFRKLCDEEEFTFKDMECKTLLKKINYMKIPLDDIAGQQD